MSAPIRLADHRDESNFAERLIARITDDRTSPLEYAFAVLMVLLILAVLLEIAVPYIKGLGL